MYTTNVFAGPECDSHGGHKDEVANSSKHNDYDGHDHENEVPNEAIELDKELIRKMGIKISYAKKGSINKSITLPAEIKLNRDKTAAISARYSSVVRQSFAEIGDEVKKGDVLASLENSETMAVYTVSAPLYGVVISKNLSVGEAAAEGEVLYEIADLSSVWSDISVFPQYHHLVNKGMKVNFVAHDGHTAEGIVKYVSPIASNETRTFTARCVLEGQSEDFAPGVFVRANINLEQVDVDLVISREAVQHIDGESVVFIPDGHGFVATPVKTGLKDEDNVEIHSGLKVNDRYVEKGAFSLKAHMVTSGMDPHAGHGH